MGFDTVSDSGVTFVEAHSGDVLMETPRDVTLLIEACFSARTRCALLYPANLTPAFFDVSSLEAGEILQKLRNYRIHLAVVVDSGAAGSRRFHQLLEAERRDAHFSMFTDRSTAVAWLAERAAAAGAPR